MKKYNIKSYCKVNLSLHVLKRLKNGYHSISSLITFCDLHDLITISANKKLKDSINFSGKFKRGIDKKSNTVTQILSLLRKKKLLRKEYFKINIKKNVPHGSGLGGGSSNAACLLKYLNLKKKLSLSKKKIITYSNIIGFDVPINLEKKNSFLTGKKGEIIRLKNKFKLCLLMVYPNLVCSTKKIYQKNKNIKLIKPALLPKEINKKNLIKLLKKETNDLEKTVIRLYPKVEKIIQYIKSIKGCYISRITGSGSACIGIFSNINDAKNGKRLIKLKYPKYWCVVSKTI